MLSWFLLAVVLLIFSPILFLFVGLPLLLRYRPDFFPSVFFMNWRRTILNPNYEDLRAMGVVSRGRNFYLNGVVGQIGVWHILPMVEKCETEQMEECVAVKEHPIILYNHGNSCCRAMKHRVMLYNVLSECGFHVFAFDYRGFGDSEGQPTEDGITRDARTVYDYVRSVSGENQIIIWGHSMGSGVSVQLVKELSLENQAPDGLILESAFNNLHDVVVHHPFAFPFRLFPAGFIDKFIVSHFRKNGISMESDKRIRHIVCPILQLHAADDVIIPVKLARKLFYTSSEAGKNHDYVEFKANRRYGHKFACKAEELPVELKKFARKCARMKN